MNQSIFRIKAVLFFAILSCNTIFGQYEEFVVKHVVSENQTDRNIQLLEIVLKEIAKDSRIEIIGKNDETDKPVSHFIEGFVNYNISNKGLKSSKFIDSTQTATFIQKFDYSGKMQLLLTSVETGQVKSVNAFNAKGEHKGTHKLKYAKVGYKSGEDKDAEKAKVVLSKANKSLFSVIQNDREKAWKGLTWMFVQRAGSASREIFPFRLEVPSVVKLKKDKAKVVAVAHDERFKKFTEAEGVLFTLNNRDFDGTKVEEFKILGSGKMNRKGKTATSFNCKISRSSSERKVQAAFEKGEKVYFSFGGKPYTKQADKKRINIAVSNIKFPEVFTEKTKNDLYTKLKFTLYSRPGVSVLDRKKFENILAEKEKQKSEEYMDKEIIEQFNAIGADFILEVDFNETPTVGQSKSNIQMPSKAHLNEYFTEYHFLARLYEVATGELVAEEQLRSSPKVLLDKTKKRTNNQILNIGASSAGFPIGSLINNAVPPKVVCYEVLEEKDGKAQKVLLYGDVRYAKRDKFEIIRKSIVEVGGKKLERFSVIGKLSLGKSKGSGLVEAKVKSGGDVILQAMENGEELICTDKPNWIERWGNSVEDRRKRYGY